LWCVDVGHGIKKLNYLGSEKPLPTSIKEKEPLWYGYRKKRKKMKQGKATGV